MKSARPPRQKKQLVLRLSLLLVVGFLTTSLMSYFISRSSLRTQISSSALPLTSDNIYSEIQRDLLRPILISSLMANDTFLRDWVLDGEKDQTLITKYLSEIVKKHDTFTGFFVSEATKTYYHPGGILKQIRPDEPRDKWYFRVKDMAPDYEINVDPDMANKDTMTIFTNHRVYDYSGTFIGAAGVGLATDSVIALVDNYRTKYDRHICFIDRDGAIVLAGACKTTGSGNIRTMEGISSVADEILSADRAVLKYAKDGGTVHLNTRFIPELKWYLLVEQTEEGAVEGIHNALVLNILLCALVTAVAIFLTSLTIDTYETISREQQDEIVTKHEELLRKNSQLEEAIVEVTRLSGLLPICASCKKIRNDEGYWQQIESYIQDHSEAEFTHGICPDCSRSLYPEIRPKEPDTD
jgi:hypothetical protein